MKSLNEKKYELQQLIEESSDPRDSLHVLYKLRMRDILFDFSLDLLNFIKERKQSKLTNVDLEEFVYEFVNKSFIKGE